MIDGHALVVVSGGGREQYLERKLIPSMQLLRGDWRVLPLKNSHVLHEAGQQFFTNTLVNVSQDVPALIAGAYSLYSRRQLSEALIDAWIVCEQIVNHLWNEYLATISDGQRAKRLKDSRTYSAAVRTEVLLSVGRIPSDHYDQLNDARKHRNELAHGAKTDLAAASAAVNAMKTMIEFICGRNVESPQVANYVTW